MPKTATSVFSLVFEDFCDDLALLHFLNIGRLEADVLHEKGVGLTRLSLTDSAWTAQSTTPPKRPVGISLPLNHHLFLRSISRASFQSCFSAASNYSVPFVGSNFSVPPPQFRNHPKASVMGESSFSTLERLTIWRNPTPGVGASGTKTVILSSGSSSTIATSMRMSGETERIAGWSWAVASLPEIRRGQAPQDVVRGKPDENGALEPAAKATRCRQYDSQVPPSAMVTISIPAAVNL